MNNTIELQIKTTAEGAVQSVKMLKNSLSDTKNVVDKTSASISKMGKAFSLGAAFASGSKIMKTFINWMNTAVDRTEELNLFNVVFKNMEKNGVKTFSTLGKEATRFQNKLNQSFGTNMTDTLRAQSLFQSMGENAGIDAKYSAIMSETMTKFAYDLGSLYNKSEKDVAEALRAGIYAGQTKPLRAYGIDVTQTSMKPMLEQLGMSDRSVSTLNQAEKEILRYVSALKQARVAMGDYADTIESPANQMKVFKNTLVDAKVALSGLFIGTFAKILPYANALLMVIREVSKAIATMFGIKISDYNTGISSVGDAYEDIAEGADSAASSVKELKRQTLGFDQINNLTEDSNNGGGGSSGGVSGGIDQRLLDAIQGYDNGMDRIKMKATDIYEKIMGWLGFTKEINSETGEVSWKLTDNNSTMGKILNSLKNIVKYGKDAITGVFKVLKKDFDNGAFGKYISLALETFVNLLKEISESKASQKLLAKLLEGFIAFKTVSGVLNKVEKSLLALSKALDVIFGSMRGLSAIFSGLTIATTGLLAVHDSITGITKDGADLINVSEGLLGTTATILGTTTALTAVLGPLGTVLGVIIGLTGTLASATNAMFGEDQLVNDISKVNSEIENYRDTMKQLDEQKQSNLEKNLNELGYYQDLYNELKLITDENGNILSGYETRANFIVNELSESLGLEIKIVDGQVQKYDELEKKVNDVIEAKRAQYLLDANADKYNAAKDESVKLEKAYAEAVKNTESVISQANPTFDKLQEAFKLSDKELQNFIDTGTLSLKHVSIMTDEMSALKDSAFKYREKLELARKSEEDAGQVWSDNQKIIGDYETALGLLEEKNYSAVTKIYTDTIEYQGKTRQETQKNYDYAIKSQEKYLKDLENNKYGYDEAYLEGEKNRTKLKIEQLEKEKQETLNEIEKQNELVKLKTLDGINKQLGVIKEKSYEFKETASGNMRLYVDGIASGREISTATMSKLVSDTIQKIKDKKMNAKEAGEYLVDGVNLGIGNSSKQRNVYSTIGNFTSNIINLFKSGLDIHSPSKATKTMGRQLLEGFTIGVNDERNNVIKCVDSFTTDIIDKMNTDLNRFEFDFNKDFSHSISGNISSTNSLSIGNDMADRISTQIASAINNQTINVRLDAHTDEGVIIDRINQKTNQTGVCPINIPY